MSSTIEDLVQKLLKIIKPKALIKIFEGFIGHTIKVK